MRRFLLIFLICLPLFYSSQSFAQKTIWNSYIHLFFDDDVTFAERENLFVSSSQIGKGQKQGENYGDFDTISVNYDKKTNTIHTQVTGDFTNTEQAAKTDFIDLLQKLRSLPYIRNNHDTPKKLNFVLPIQLFPSGKDFIPINLALGMGGDSIKSSHNWYLGIVQPANSLSYADSFKDNIIYFSYRKDNIGSMPFFIEMKALDANNEFNIYISHQPSKTTDDKGNCIECVDPDQYSVHFSAEENKDLNIKEGDLNIAFVNHSFIAPNRFKGTSGCNNLEDPNCLNTRITLTTKKSKLNATIGFIIDAFKGKDGYKIQLGDTHGGGHKITDQDYFASFIDLYFKNLNIGFNGKQIYCPKVYLALGQSWVSNKPGGCEPTMGGEDKFVNAWGLVSKKKMGSGFQCSVLDDKNKTIAGIIVTLKHSGHQEKGYDESCRAQHDDASYFKVNFSNYNPYPVG